MGLLHLVRFEAFHSPLRVCKSLFTFALDAKPTSKLSPSMASVDNNDSHLAAEIEQVNTMVTHFFVKRSYF